MADFNPPNRYSSTPRKVFDKHVDRMELRRKRDKEDHRADFKALFQRIRNLEIELSHLIQQQNDLYAHVDRHCAELDTDRKGNEELG